MSSNGEEAQMFPIDLELSQAVSAEVEATLTDQQAATIAGRRYGKTPSDDTPDWKRRQAIRTPAPRLLETTVPMRINRLNPQERHEVQSLIRSMKLRKIIRRTLAEAYWARQDTELANLTSASASHASMQKLRAAVRRQESLRSYNGTSTTSVDLSTQLVTRGPALIQAD